MSTELGPAQAPIQDAHSQTHAHMCQTSGLVRDDRPEGYFLVSILSRHKLLLWFAFEG